MTFEKDTENQFDGSEIAIIGMAGRFPGASTLDEYWENLCAGRESVTFFSDEELLESGVDPVLLRKPEYVKARPILENIEFFDSVFFGFSPLEANFMDPQHRIFLECVWQAIESAGYNPENYEGAISVFAGASMNSYLPNNIYANPEAVAAAGNFQGAMFNNVSSLTTLIAYKLNLKGACFSVQTFCSTSLVATHIACQSLLNYECDMAVAGGVSITVPQKSGYIYEEGLILSPDGHCRPFSDDAQGTIFGNGLGAVVFKRLEDALADGDSIDALIIGSAVNNDGSLKASYAAPSVEGQKNVIIEAISNAEINPETISYVETHGTGTALGDPTEISALSKAFQSMTEQCGFCAIGSVKANIGHLDVAAGVASLIKTVLMLKNKSIPPSINFNQPNANINFSDSPFFVNTELREWQADKSPRRLGISSFGVGGTNVHMILQEAPQWPQLPSPRENSLFLLSAKTLSSLEKIQSNLSTFLGNNRNINISDVAYTLQLGRKAFNYRRMFVCQDIDNAVAELEIPPTAQAGTCYQEKRNPKIVFMFSGQGSQYVNMGFDLYKNEPLFKENVDRCANILRPHLGLDIREILFPKVSSETPISGDINQTHLTQPALFIIEFSLAQLFLSWGIRPAALIGHSIGEYVAATIAGVFSLDQALSLVAVRGRLMNQTLVGAMLSATLTEKEAKAYISEDIELSVINAPSLCVFSGTIEAIEKLQNILSKQKLRVRKLLTSRAFHSKMMDPVLDEFASHLKGLDINHPQIPYISNLTGNWITDEESINADYWVSHLRSTVRFSDGIRNLAGETDYLYLEIGPGNVLSTLTKAHFSPEKMPSVLSSMRHPQEESPDSAFLLNTLGRLWLEGCDVEWNKYYEREKRYRLALPNYPFDNKYHWINPTESPRGFAAVKAGLVDAGKTTTWEGAEQGQRDSPEKELSGLVVDNFVAPRNDVEKSIAKIWRGVLGIERIGVHENFLDIGGNSLSAVRVFTHIYEEFGIRLPLATLFSSPTIEKLAKLIGDEGFENSWSSLVEIQPSGTKPPFFFIHSEGGNVIEYYPLSQHLGDNQPVYGLQARGLTGDKVEDTSVVEMAHHYLQDIRKKQPEGPYFLAGFCLGGLIAFEIAKQLEKEHGKVAFLGMISTSTPAHVSVIKHDINMAQKIYYSNKERIALELSNMSVLTIKEKIRFIRDRITRLSLHLRFHYEKFVSGLFRKFNLGEYEHSRAFKLEELGKVQNRAFRNYLIPTPIQTPITLIRPSNQPYVRINDSNLGWRGFSEGGVEHYEINCFHKNILKEPHVSQLALILEKCLEDAQK